MDASQSSGLRVYYLEVEEKKNCFRGVIERYIEVDDGVRNMEAWNGMR